MGYCLEEAGESSAKAVALCEMRALLPSTLEVSVTFYSVPARSETYSPFFLRDYSEFKRFVYREVEGSSSRSGRRPTLAVVESTAAAPIAATAKGQKPSGGRGGTDSLHAPPFEVRTTYARFSSRIENPGR
jgi:hypothetical protein